MNKKLVSMLGLTFALAGLGCDQPIDGSNPGGGAGTSGPAPLTAEEQAVVDNMKKNTLAEIDLPEGTMRFVEVAPGDVAVLRQFRAGSKLTRVEGEEEMELDQLFRAYAPGRQTPAALMAAMDRVHAAQRTAAAEPQTDAVEEILYQGDRPANDGLVNADGTESISSGLVSAIDQNWFINNYCGFRSVNASWCYTSAWTNAWGKRSSHRHNAAVCGDTGAAQVRSYVSGSLRVLLDVAYGACWTIGWYHGPHGFFGQALSRTIETKIPWVESSVRFSGYFADGDQFIGSPY